MSIGIVSAAYIVAAILFILSLGGLSNQESAKRAVWYGIAGMADLLDFFARLPNPDKQFKSMAGISHASFHQKNYLMVYQILLDFLSQPGPLYRG